MAHTEVKDTGGDVDEEEITVTPTTGPEMTLMDLRAKAGTEDGVDEVCFTFTLSH